MAEYIEREAVYNTLKAKYCDECTDEKCQMCEYADIMFVLDNLPIADVQPVDRWISVDETLPVYDGRVLVYDKSKNIRIGIYTEIGWCSQFENPMMYKITHWQPLPEPPKDGEQK